MRLPLSTGKNISTAKWHWQMKITSEEQHLFRATKIDVAAWCCSTEVRQYFAYVSMLWCSRLSFWYNGNLCRGCGDRGRHFVYIGNIFRDFGGLVCNCIYRVYILILLWSWLSICKLEISFEVREVEFECYILCI